MMTAIMRQLLFLFIVQITYAVLLAEPTTDLIEDSKLEVEKDSTESADTALVPVNDSLLVRDSVQLSVNIIDTAIIIPRLDFSSIHLSDALTALARAHNLSLYIDSSVTGLISIRLDNVTLNDALLFIIKEYRLAWERTGGITKIYRPVAPILPPPPLNVTYDDNLLSLDINEAPLQKLVDTIITLTGRNIILENGVSGSVTGKLTNLSVDKLLNALLPSNGFSLRTLDDLIYIGPKVGQENSAKTRYLKVTCSDGLVSVDVANTNLNDVVMALVDRCGIDVFILTPLEGIVNANFENKTVDETLTFLLLNTKFSFSITDGIFFVGSRDSEGLFDSKLIRFKHLIAPNIESLIPASLGKQVTIKVIPEHNGLILSGPRTAIAKVESFVNAIDIPTAQVLFDVLVVDYSMTKASEFGITANNFGGDPNLPGQVYWPEVDISATGSQLNDNIESISRHLSISNPITLSDDFFLRLKMLQRDGIANIISHPKIASLNGHTASIQIGTTQYYLLESKTIHPSTQSDVSTQTSQRFEQIKAEMSLEVTPYVGSGDEIIVEIKPEFSSPAERFDPDIPPTINRRILSSTVRLLDGETIVLGGLIQENEVKSISKVPILGSIPLLGRLFQNRVTSTDKSELMIYITPHIYYGSGGTVNVDSILQRR